MCDNQKTKAKQQLQLEKREWSKLFDIQRQQSVRQTSHLLDHESFLRAFKGKETPDAELIEDYNLNHNQQAFDELYRRHKSKMLAYIYTIVHDNDDSRDVLHNAWEKVLIAFKNRKYLENQGFGKWFKSICYREARLWNLEKQRCLHGMEYMPDKPDRSFSAEQQLINSETETLLHKALSRLDEEDRKIVILHAWEERSFDVIGVILHLNTYTVRSRYYRAIKQMRDRVNGTH